VSAGAEIGGVWVLEYTRCDGAVAGEEEAAVVGDVEKFMAVASYGVGELETGAGVFDRCVRGGVV
jgi:hypothetical protein